jgi:hypothetical protein
MACYGDSFTFTFYFNIISTLKSRGMRWEGPAACKGDTKHGYEVLVTNPELKRYLGVHKCGNAVILDLKGNS